MKGAGTWVTDTNLGLFTDLYQLTMAQAYWRESMNDAAVFTLFSRRLPSNWKYLIACGLDDALHCLEALHFDGDAIAYLASQANFSAGFLDFLLGLRFSGDVHAVPEGTPVFGGEPIVEVVAPLIEAQLVETIVMNQVHMQTVLASKASRIVRAAEGRPVIDFGLRRIHGTDAGLKSARAFHIAGVAATSNVLAGQVYGVPIAGTIGHSYIQAHDREIDAFREFLQSYPGSILLVDTYDTIAGVEQLIQVAKELGPAFRARGIRLDSGDLGALAVESRRMLDRAGLEGVRIFASGGLDENSIAALLASGAPIDGFGVGSSMGNATDAPALDMAYKLAEYAGRGRLKTSPGKPVLPGRKQILRRERNGRAEGDVIARADEPLDELEGRPLMNQVMRDGRRVPAQRDTLERARTRAQEELALLPDAVTSLSDEPSGYPVDVSLALRQFASETIAAVKKGSRTP